MILRCKVDRLLLPAAPHSREPVLVVHDGAEKFHLERVEALYYELVEGTTDDILWLARAGYRLLDRAGDFRHTRRYRPA